MRNIYNILEFNVIRDNVAKFAKTEIGLERARSLSIIEDEQHLKDELAILDEALSCINRFLYPPINSSINLSPYLDLASKGGILTPHDFSSLVHDIDTINDIYEYFNKLHDKYIHLGEKVDTFYNLNPLKDEIEKIIAPDLSIKDSASPELNRLRKKINSLSQQISSEINVQFKKYKDYLNGSAITLRDGHYVLPISSNNKNKIEGIVHDVSDSGQTTFIEPSSIVAISNDLYIAKRNEQDEIKRILKELTDKLLIHKDEIIYNNKLIGYLDFVFSKASYAVENKASIAHLSEDGRIFIDNGRHPLLDSKTVVSNSLSLNKENRILLVSGPNAGGKSIVLKSMGLFALMNQSGLAIPALEDSYIPIFHDVFVDIGDAQSISDNLSTFSGHIRNLVYILDNVKEGDLVIIDEIGTGTSPQEGEALAYAIINSLINKKCYALISSHYEGLKAFALSNKNIENGSMIFDDKKLLPTYKLKQGLPGKSYGIEMAKRYKMNDKVLSMASKYLSSQEHDSLNNALNELSIKQKQTEIELARLHNDAIAQEKINKELDKEKKIYQNKIQQFEDEMNMQKNLIINKTSQEVDQLIKDLSKPNIKLHEAIEIKSKLDALKTISHNDETLNETIQIGDYIEIIDTDFVGKVLSVNGNKLTISTSSGLSIKTNKNKAHKIDPPDKIEHSSNTINIMPSMSSELNVIGFHVDEALLAVDRYLNEAIVHHLHEVRIVHGMGSGALQTAIHNYLKQQKFVKEYHYAPNNLGGSGATLVSLL
jgi:DNA mismatch repair protein MutS2